MASSSESLDHTPSTRTSWHYRGRDDDIELVQVSQSSVHKHGDNLDEALLPEHDHLSVEPNDRAHPHTSSSQASRKRGRRLQGWRFGVASAAGLATTVLLLNTIFTAWAASHFHASLENGVGTAYSGNCKTVATWSTCIHILINVLSSIMLSASNYTMQCLSSPTRKEIDSAHAKGDWVDVGVASIRNLSRIRSSRVCLWWLLALSSIPIHLLYNSAVFKTLETTNYAVVVVNEDFFDGVPVYIDDSTDGSLYQSSDIAENYGLLQELQTNASTDAAYKETSLYERLDNSGCMAAYSTSFVSGRTNVFAVTSTRTNNASETAFWLFLHTVDTDYLYDYNPYGWICQDTSYGYCDVASIRRKAANWTIDHHNIEYCLSEIVPANCKLQFSTYIMAAVIIMNACKSLAMLLTLYNTKEVTMVTVGDALASFLKHPDSLTKGRCMMAKCDIIKDSLRWSSVSQPLPLRVDKPVRRRWFAAASVTRWVITLTLIAAALGTAAGLLGVGIHALRTRLGTGQSVFSLGFGAVDSRSIIQNILPSSVVVDVLIANTPQLICSFLYFAYNALFTCMVLSHEYSQYGLGNRHKPLRVTDPRGKQRTTYYLHLPYRYSLPLLAASTTLHWLISQSLFQVNISVLQYSSPGASQLGYSCAPILCTIILGSIMLLTAVGFGCRKFASGIPVASSCSAALSAACHPPNEDTDAGYLPVRWGAIQLDNEQDEEIGHCSFTSGAVHDLVPGRMYAGL